MLIAVYLISSVFLLVIAFIVFRIFVRRDYKRKGRLTPFLTFLEVLIFALHANFAYIYVPAVWPALPSLPESPLHRTTGLILISIGLVTVVMAMTGLGFSRALGQKVNVLKQSGFYQVTRNPQIVGYASIVIGCAALWPSWYVLGWVLLYGTIAHMMVITEEEHLRKVHGDQYEKYCEKVPRYIALPWRK